MVFRFLYRCPETKVRTNNLLTTMMRLRNVKHFDNRQETVIDVRYARNRAAGFVDLNATIEPRVTECVLPLQAPGTCCKPQEGEGSSQIVH